MTTSLVLHQFKGALTSALKRGPYAQAPLPAAALAAPPTTPDPRRVRRYAQVCGYDPEATTLPPTYPHLMAFPLTLALMARRDFPFPLLGLVHTRIELSQHRPLTLDGALRLTVRAEGPHPHRKGTAFGLVTEAEQDGETVWHSRSTYLCRHRTTAPGTGPENTSREQTRPGPPLPAVATWRLPGALGRRYASVSGDRNPIHLHPLTARAFGFPRAIAHGMWTFARCLAAHETADLSTAEADFKAPVLLPAEVTYAADPATGAFALRGAGEEEKLHLTGLVRRTAGPGPHPFGATGGAG